MKERRKGRIACIKPDSVKGKQIRKLLMQVKKRRKQWNLPGSDPKYEFNLGCYGNPNSRIVFVAEIANVKGLDRILKRNPSHDKLWATAWEGKSRNKTLRDALIRQKLIPEDGQAKPWTWNCWISNFIKSADANDAWKRRKREKVKILQDSAEILAQELCIIRPEIVVFIGSNSMRYFKSYLWTRIEIDMPALKMLKVRHYGARESPQSLTKHYTKTLRGILRDSPGILL